MSTHPPTPAPSLLIEQIAIGDELLNGLVVDENSAWLSRAVSALGVEVVARQVVADRIADVVAAHRLAASRAEYVVVSGGLGPTVDDLTADASAEFLGVPVELNAIALEQVTARRSRSGGMMRSIDDKQARLPVGATVLENPVGSAPAFQVVSGQTTFVYLPGVPREYRTLCDLYVLPELRRRSPSLPESRTWKFFGVTESELAEQVAKVDTEDAVLHYRAHFPEVHLTVVTRTPSPSSGPSITQRVEDHLRAHVWQRYFGDQDATFPGAVIKALVSSGQTVAVAESCTGGLVGQLLTSVPGSSAAFLGGVIAYDNGVKERLLGVAPALLLEHGAVSQACVEAMARGAREQLGASIGIATTGIAGPGGGTPEKPVGTIHIALDHLASDKSTRVRHRALRLPFDRDRNRLATAYGALDLIRRHLSSQSDTSRS